MTYLALQTVSADGNGSLSHLPGQAEPPPPYTYSVVYTAAPLGPTQEGGPDAEPSSEPPPPAYSEAPPENTETREQPNQEGNSQTNSSTTTAQATPPAVTTSSNATTTSPGATNNQTGRQTTGSETAISSHGTSNPAFEG